MHTYPAWKIWLVAIVLLVALVLALPNVFGEAPALQLSRNDRTAVTEAGSDQVVTQLQSRQIEVESAYLEGDRLVLRFDDGAQQLKARDVLHADFAREYLVELSKVPRTPATMRANGLNPITLGLDQRGGHYIQ